MLLKKQKNNLLERNAAVNMTQEKEIISKIQYIEQI